MGCSTTDGDRFENLKTTTDLIEKLITEVQYVTRGRNSHEASVKVAGEYANTFLCFVGEELSANYKIGEDK